MTLPEATLDGLSRIDTDRGRAIVKLTEAALGEGGSARPQVEMVDMAANARLIVVGASRALKCIPFLHTVEVAPGRYLLAMAPGHDFKSLELAIRDILDDMPDTEEQEKALLKDLLSHIKDLRQTDRVSVAEILIIKPGRDKRG